VKKTRAKKPAARAEFEQSRRAARFILAKTRLRPRVGLVLGSGLGAFADSLSAAARIPYGKIPHFPQSSVAGHAGTLVVGKTGGAPVAAMQGRVHFYDGYSLKELIFPMRVFRQMGIRAVILTNAAGGINPEYRPGNLVVLRDHINLQGSNPLLGPNDERLGPRFFDMTGAYHKPYRELALRAAKKLGIEPREGVYAAVSGPSYETPAEIHYLRAIGADLVGMSTVPEVIAARHMEMRVLAISCVTNMAAGMLDQKLSHEEVLEIGHRVQGQFEALLCAVIPQIAEDAAG